MAGFAIVLPIILLMLILLGLKRSFLSKLSLNKKWTYVFLITYFAILLIATITSEIFTNRLDEQPNHITEEEVADIENALYNGTLATVAPSDVIDKRKHQIGDVLSISTTNDEYYPNIMIERKNVNDGMIEETIYKPRLIIDSYDLSDHVNFVLPEWNDDEVVFLTPPPSRTTLTSYENAFLLSQFTSTPSEALAYSHASTLRQISIHLRVPKDLKIEAEEEMYIDYVNK